jgi:hypothetical protein
MPGGGQPVGERQAKGFCSEWTAEQIPLIGIASQVLQTVALLVCFHPFGDRAHAELMGYGQHATHQAAIAGAGGQPLHKRLIHLDQVHWQRLQQRERGIAGAEIINGQGDAK